MIMSCMPAPTEELKLLWGHEEPRKAARTGTICYCGRRYRVPDPYIGRRVWTRRWGDPPHDLGPADDPGMSSLMMTS